MIIGVKLPALIFTPWDGVVDITMPFNHQKVNVHSVRICEYDSV